MTPFLHTGCWQLPDATGLFDWWFKEARACGWRRIAAMETAFLTHHSMYVDAAIRTPVDGGEMRERVVGRHPIEQQSMTALAMAFIVILRCLPCTARRGATNVCLVMSERCWFAKGTRTTRTHPSGFPLSPRTVVRLTHTLYLLETKRSAYEEIFMGAFPPPQKFETRMCVCCVWAAEYGIREVLM